MSVVRLNKIKRRQLRQAKARKQVEGNLVAIGTVAANKWTPEQLVFKAVSAHAAILASLKLNGLNREHTDASFQFMAAAVDYAMQTHAGKGYDPVTLKVLGLQTPEQETASRLDAMGISTEPEAG